MCGVAAQTAAVQDTPRLMAAAEYRQKNGGFKKLEDYLDFLESVCLLASF